ncbi:9132_t:CDS:2, partial [Dentiscutata erythropus]
IVIMDQDNSSTFQYNSEEDTNNLLESNSESSLPYNLECFPEHSTSLYTSEYSTSPYNSDQFTSISDNPENLISLLENFDYSDSSNSNTTQNTKKHKSEFIISPNKKSRPEKSRVWHHMKKDKIVKKETICLVPVKQNEKIEKCGETFALSTSTSTLGSHLPQKDPTQPTLLDIIKKPPPLLSKKKID